MKEREEKYFDFKGITIDGKLSRDFALSESMVADLINDINIQEEFLEEGQSLGLTLILDGKEYDYIDLLYKYQALPPTGIREN